MKVNLVVQGGKNDGAIIAINKPSFVIGRAPECNLRMESKALSRTHAQIKISSDGVTIKDLGSTNGTCVDGVKITEETPLKNGQVLRIGPLNVAIQIAAEMGGAKNPRVGSVADAVDRVAAKNQEDDDEIDLSALFGEDSNGAGEDFQKMLTTVVDFNKREDAAEKEQKEQQQHSKDSREAAERTLEAMFKSTFKK